MKNKINWWVIAAIIVIGVPIGYVSMGIIERLKQNHKADPVEVCSACGKDIALCEYRGEHPDSIQDSNNIQNPDTDIESEVTPEEESNEVTETEPAVKKQTKADAESKSPTEVEAQKQAQAEAKRQEELAAKAEADRKVKEEKAKAEEERKEKVAAEAKKALIAEMQPIVASGNKSNKFSENCSFIVNGRKMDFQNFSTGVQYSAYTNVKVADITLDSKGNVTLVKVTATATEQKD